MVMNRKEKLRWDLGLILMIMLVIVGQAIQAIPVAIAEGIVQPTGVCLAQSGQTRGMVADNSTHSVTVFNADTDTVLGTVFLPGFGSGTGDCSITADLTRGFVTDFTNQVWVIDLTTSPPSLPSGTNPILI